MQRDPRTAELPPHDGPGTEPAPNEADDQATQVAEIKRAQDDGGARRALIAARIAFAAEPVALPKTAQGHGYRYTTLGSLLDAVRQPLAAHGLVLRWASSSDTETVTVTAVLEHLEGAYDEAGITLPYDGGPRRSGAQAAGSAISYAKRYTALNVLGLASGIDDDGATGEAGGKATASQIDRLRGLVRAGRVDWRQLIEAEAVERVEDIPAARFQAILDKLGREDDVPF